MINRDYPVMFGTLYVFVDRPDRQLIGDIAYTVIDPRIDFQSRAEAASPLNQRRWANFKNNRRGYWSMWLFLCAQSVSQRNLSPMTNRC